MMKSISNKNITENISIMRRSEELFLKLNTFVELPFKIDDGPETRRFHATVFDYLYIEIYIPNPHVMITV